MARRDLGAEWIASMSQLSAAYGLDEATMQQRVYALSEQIHAHYCFARGPVNHSESRPDEHIAAGILGALVGADWWLVRGPERNPFDTFTRDVGPDSPWGASDVDGEWVKVEGQSDDQTEG